MAQPAANAVPKPETPAWRRRLTWLGIIYLIAEQKKKFSAYLEGDDKLLEPELERMFRVDLVDLTQKPEVQYIVTPKALDFRHSMVVMYDAMQRYEIFATVNHQMMLTEAQRQDPGNPLYALSDQLDPRFAEGPESIDLRLAMIGYLGEVGGDQLNGKQPDLYDIVFMQMVARGDLKAENAVYRLRDGSLLDEVEQRVTTAHQWRQMAPTEQEAADRMADLYTIGMIEQAKRNGDKCGKCGTCLQVFEEEAKARGETLDACPNPDCTVSFKAPPSMAATVTETCPNCQTEIQPRWRKCHGCNAKINRSLPEGTVEDRTTAYTTTETIPVWDSYYGYTPPVFVYSPWNAFDNVVFLAALCTFDGLPY